MIFIISSRECLAITPPGVNELKDLLNKPLMPQDKSDDSDQSDSSDDK